jgi:hypothetical protein
MCSVNEPTSASSIDSKMVTFLHARTKLASVVGSVLDATDAQSSS